MGLICGWFQMETLVKKLINGDDTSNFTTTLQNPEVRPNRFPIRFLAWDFSGVGLCVVSLWCPCACVRDVQVLEEYRQWGIAQRKAQPRSKL